MVETKGEMVSLSETSPDREKGVHRFQLVLSQKTWGQLSDLAEGYGKSVTQIIREAIRLRLEIEAEAEEAYGVPGVKRVDLEIREGEKKTLLIL